MSCFADAGAHCSTFLVCTSLQHAAFYIQQSKDAASKAGDLTPDLSPEYQSAWQCVVLAQGMECLYLSKSQFPTERMHSIIMAFLAWKVSTDGEIEQSVVGKVWISRALQMNACVDQGGECASSEGNGVHCDDLVDLWCGDDLRVVECIIYK
jgi:hypothetical protein